MADRVIASGYDKAPWYCIDGLIRAEIIRKGTQIVKLVVLERANPVWSWGIPATTGLTDSKAVETLLAGIEMVCPQGYLPVVRGLKVGKFCDQFALGI